MALSVLLLSRYARRGASSRVRFYIYCDALKEAGISLTPAPFFDDDYLAALYGNGDIWRLALRAYGRRLVRAVSAGRYDLLWIEKELAPWLPAWVERLAASGMPYAVDFDDAWFLRYRSHRFPPLRALLAGKLERVAQGAALTIAGNEYLAQWARDAGASRVLQLPSVVDLTRYPLRPPSEGPFIIGWIGTPATAHYLRQIAGPLHRFCAEFGAKLLVIGADRFVLDDVPIEHASWDETTEAALLSRCDVGIMPLVDDAWSRGKCGYKLIQYMAAGRPVVASPVGVNTTIVRHGENGFLAETPQQWIDALIGLRNDPMLRIELGAAGRRLVESTYCVEKTSPILAQELYTAAGRTP